MRKRRVKWWLNWRSSPNAHRMERIDGVKYPRASLTPSIVPIPGDEDGGMKGALDVAGVVANLPVSEPQRGQARRDVSLVADMVFRLLAGSPVVAQSVGLDDEPQVWPVEIDPDAI